MLREIFSDPISAVTFVIMWVIIIPAVQRWWNNRKNSANGIQSSKKPRSKKDIPVDKDKYPKAKRHKKNY